jgi:Domain of unknown function (DUF3854)/D5 N terminal like
MAYELSPIKSLEVRHYEELKASGITDEIIEQNFWTIADGAELDRLLNRNSDRRWKHSDLAPGWAVAGIDPKTGERLFKGAQFKPDQPRLRDEKPVKYESISGVELSPLFLDGAIDWATVLKDEGVAIADGEGAKKAAALLSIGQAAIAHSGVTTGQKKGRLRHEVLPFYKPGRTVYLVYDADWRENLNVAAAIQQQGRLIKAKGAMVYVVVWNAEQGKGIDDYLMNFAEHDRGKEWQRLCEAALTYEEWLVQVKSHQAELLKQKALEATIEKTRSGEINFEVTTTSDDWLYSQVFRPEDYVVIDDVFYRWDGKSWQKVIDRAIEKEIALKLRQAYVVQKSGETKHSFATESKVKSGFGFLRKVLDLGLEQKPHTLVSFRNGVLDMATMELLPQNPTFYLTAGIDADYAPGQDCPEIFHQFLQSSYGADVIPLVQAAIAMMVNPCAPWGKFIHIMGESGSGKGVLLRVLQGLFGTKHSRSGSSFGELATPEGRHQNLSGVLGFFLPDVGGFVQGVRAFYELVDNGQMSGRALYSSSGYQKQWSVRFAIGSVAPLQVENSGDGWDRRALVIPTLGAIVEKDPGASHFCDK